MGQPSSSCRGDWYAALAALCTVGAVVLSSFATKTSTELCDTPLKGGYSAIPCDILKNIDAIRIAIPNSAIGGSQCWPTKKGMMKPKNVLAWPN